MILAVDVITTRGEIEMNDTIHTHLLIRIETEEEETRELDCSTRGSWPVLMNAANRHSEKDQLPSTEESFHARE